MRWVRENEGTISDIRISLSAFVGGCIVKKQEQRAARAGYRERLTDGELELLMAFDNTNSSQA